MGTAAGDSARGSLGLRSPTVPEPTRGELDEIAIRPYPCGTTRGKGFLMVRLTASSSVWLQYAPGCGRVDSTMNARPSPRIPGRVEFDLLIRFAERSGGAAEEIGLVPARLGPRARKFTLVQDGSWCWFDVWPAIDTMPEILLPPGGTIDFYYHPMPRQERGPLLHVEAYRSAGGDDAGSFVDLSIVLRDDPHAAPLTLRVELSNHRTSEKTEGPR